MRNAFCEGGAPDPGQCSIDEEMREEEGRSGRIFPFFIPLFRLFLQLPKGCS